MSVKELRTFIERAGLSHADCLEKEDLRTRAKEAPAVLARASPAADTASTTTADVAAEGTAVAPTFPLEALQGGVPAGVDASKKESSLSDADFQKHFGMDKAAFAKMPGWKQKGAKSKLRLF
jgi:hypothetical protein